MLPVIETSSPAAASTERLPGTGTPNRSAAAHDPLSSALLLAGHDAVRIEHLGQCYVLRATRAGKLILTK